MHAHSRSSCNHNAVGASQSLGDSGTFTVCSIRRQKLDIYIYHIYVYVYATAAGTSEAFAKGEASNSLFKVKVHIYDIFVGTKPNEWAGVTEPITITV